MELPGALTEPSQTVVRLRFLQVLVLVFAVITALRAVGEVRAAGVGPWAVGFVLCAAASIGFLAWSVRTGAWKRRGPEVSDVAFRAKHTGLVLVAYVAALVVGSQLGSVVAGRAGAIFGANVLTGSLCLWLTWARVAVVNRLPEQGRELPAALMPSKLEEWSERRLGRWWVAEMAYLAAAVLGLSALMGNENLAGLLFVPALGQGDRLYAARAFARGFDWPGRYGQEQAAARQRELKAQPEYQALRAKYGPLDVLAVCVGLVGMVVPVVASLDFPDGHDARIGWLLGMALGGLAGWPMAFIGAVLAVRGRAYRRGYVEYLRMEGGEGATVMAWLGFGCLLFTVGCAIGLLVSLGVFTKG